MKVITSVGKLKKIIQTINKTNEDILRRLEEIERNIEEEKHTEVVNTVNKLINTFKLDRTKAEKCIYKSKNIKASEIQNRINEVNNNFKPIYKKIKVNEIEYIYDINENGLVFIEKDDKLIIKGFHSDRKIFFVNN